MNKDEQIETEQNSDNNESVQEQQKIQEQAETISMPSSDPSGVIKFGLSIIFVVFGVIGTWATFAPLATSSVAVGKVSADLNKKTVLHLEGGIVDAIYVKDGDIVKKD